MLSQQLRLYKPPQSGTLDDDNINKGEETQGVSNSQLGFYPKSNNTNFNNRNRAAVLVCLFQGRTSDENDDDLRVILTKRSSGLSTHSGILFPSLLV